MSLPNDHIHDRALALASAAIDFGLTDAERRELDAHLTACPTCARRAAAIRADASALTRPLGLLPSSRVDDAVYRAIAHRPARSPRPVLLLAAAVMLLAMLATLAAGAYLLRTWQTPISVVPTTNPSADGIPTATPASPDPTRAIVGGETWQALAIPASDVGDGWIGLMEAVTATESGFVAVGRSVCSPPVEPTLCHGSVWTSRPGGGWTRVADQPGLEVGIYQLSRPSTGLLDVATGPAGLVAIGYPYDARGAIGPGIWHSVDGPVWDRVEVAFGSSPAETEFHRIVAVAGGPRGYVAVGYVVDHANPAGADLYPARAAAWTSLDGVTWTRAEDTADMDVGLCLDTGEDPGCGGMRAVAATSTGFVAVGHRRVTGEDGTRPAAWTSADGLTWTRTDAGLDLAGSLSAVTAGGPAIVAAGTGIDARSTDGLTWTVQSADGAPSDEIRLASDGSVVLGVAWSFGSASLQVWRTADGLTREPIGTLSLPSEVVGIRSADIAIADGRVVIVAWVEVMVSGDSGPTMMNLSYGSP